ncbi:MAG: lytic transglycosylase domain-containing protein, partial [Cytophagales bacterium]
MKFFFATFLFLITFLSKAQVVSLSDSVEIIAAADTSFVDELEADVPNLYFGTYEFVPEVTEELIRDRMSCAQGEIKLLYNPKINSFIDFFVRRRREYSILMLQRKTLYFPIFEEILKKYGMPDELKYLAVVESGLKPTALSPSNALGLWQFIPSTGRLYGLKIDNYIDERLDIVKSTESACRYLKWLYNAFGDWHLALASYNCGPGYVQRAIKKAGGKNDFWKIYDFLPQETRSYVPQFIAIAYFMQYHEDHNLFPPYQE